MHAESSAAIAKTPQQQGTILDEVTVSTRELDTAFSVTHLPGREKGTLDVTLLEDVKVKACLW